MARDCQLSTREGRPERPFQGWRVEEERIWEVLSFRNCVLHCREELGSFVVCVVVFEIISRDWVARQAETFFLVAIARLKNLFLAQQQENVQIALSIIFKKCELNFELSTGGFFPFI